MPVTLTLDPSLSPCAVQPIVVWAEEITPTEEGAALTDLFLTTQQRARREGFDEERRAAVRRMLRHGKFRATGRAKPASEFLLQTVQAAEGLSQILPPVDINNIISLESGLPASIFDTELIGNDLLLRYGVAGESYVFNSSGHSIDLEDLLVICGARHLHPQGLAIPCGNPIKDAMHTKIRQESRGVIGVVYAPADASPAFCDAVGSRFSSLFHDFCHAQKVGYFCPAI